MASKSLFITGVRKMQAAKRKELEQKKLNLKKQLNAIEILLNSDFLTKNKPLYEKKYNDTYWTGTNNYSCNGKKWTIYIHAKKVTDIWDCGSYGLNAYIICDTFQLTSDNQLLIHFDQREYPHSFKKKITKKEFNNAVSKLINKAKEAIK
jgi:hypothetical protein